MAAILKLDRFELMWLLEGAVGKSHLRWGIYKMFIEDVFKQLDDNEREFIYTYAKRDLSWMFEGECHDNTAKEYFEQLLARFNPANQYRVELKSENQYQQVQAYLYNGRYYTGENRYCADEFIINVEHLPYKKCKNDLCKSKQSCLRFKSFSEGDKMFRDIGEWPCDKCDFIIAE